MATGKSFYEVAKELETMEKKEEEKIMKEINEMGTETKTTTTKGEVIPFTTSKTPATTQKTSTKKAYNYTTYKPYTYKGEINKTAFPDFVKICKFSAKKLKQYLCREMKSIYGSNCIVGDGYIYCRGDIPVLLTAHMDTVHKETIKTYYEETTTDKDGNTEHILSSPQGIGGDDRCGIYMILEILKKGYIPYILFCEDEEIGGVGSAKFCKTEYITELSSLKFLLELDRANSDDLVFYDNGNKDWIKWVEDQTGWKKAWGTFSDISHLSPACMVSSVNLSCGYYKQHTLQEYVIVEEMLTTIEVVKDLLDASETVEQFIYEEVSYKDYGYGYNYGYNYYGGYNYGKYSSRYYDYDDDEYDAYWSRKVNTKEADKEKTSHMLEICFLNENEEEEYAVVRGNSEDECWVNFFMEYINVCFADVLDYWSTGTM